MATSWEELQKVSDEELIRQYDSKTHSTELGLGCYREEIARRSQDRTDKTMLAYTEATLKYAKQVTFLTWVTTLLSLAAFIISLIALLHH